MPAHVADQAPVPPPAEYRLGPRLGLLLARCWLGCGSRTSVLACALAYLRACLVGAPVGEGVWCHLARQRTLPSLPSQRDT